MYRILIVFAAVVAFMAADATSESFGASKSQKGVWKTTTEPKMVARISKDTIRIDWVEDDGATNLYWKGTWHDVKKNGAKVTSFGDTELMDEHMLASTSDTKTFTYSNGQLVFKFSIMGFNKRLRLQRRP